MSVQYVHKPQYIIIWYVKYLKTTPATPRIEKKLLGVSTMVSFVPTFRQAIHSVLTD